MTCLFAFSFLYDVCLYVFFPPMCVFKLRGQGFINNWVEASLCTIFIDVKEDSIQTHAALGSVSCERRESLKIRGQSSSGFRIF